MERFTSKMNGKGVIMLPAGVEHDWCIGTRKVGDVMIHYLSGAAADRLAAYEDTRLDPDEIELMKEAQEIGDNMTPHRLGEILKAERDGRLVVLPNDGHLVVLPNDGWIVKILEERDHQDQKWGSPQENTYCEWASILAEEVGELAKELNELNFGRGDTERMEAEAVQVAAVALAILEQSGVALRATEQAAKALGRVPDRPKCFYGDSDLCKGMTVNNDDEPIEACKRCRWCSVGYQQLEAEAAERREVEHR